MVHRAFRTPQDVAFLCVYAISSQNIIIRATNRKRWDRNCSSVCWGVPGGAGRRGGIKQQLFDVALLRDGFIENVKIPGGGLPSLMLNAVAKIPKGKAPIPKDIWKPPSPKPNT